MGEKIFIGNFSKGLTLDRLPFVINNDSFPALINAYSWRGRIKRKRGTKLIGRLQLQTAITGTTDNTGTLSLTLANTPVAPGSISIVIGANTYTDVGGTGVIFLSGVNQGSINYLTGDLVITGVPLLTAYTGTYSYYPKLPVMGLRDFIFLDNQYPLLLAFDTTYAYQLNQTTTPASFYNVSYYKITGTPLTWHGADYQQFWTTNYEGALWATNGVPGFHFVDGTYTSGSGTPNITFNFKSGGVNFADLVDGDILFFNEWPGTTTINLVSGTVTNDTDAVNGNYVVTFDGNKTVSGTGIALLLTASIPGQDGIRWYDGDPTGGTGLAPNGLTGWVNFNPPVTNGTFGFDNLTVAQYYLVGATAILAFKDRLLFFGPYIQASDQTSPTQLKDTVLWSWNGTPYYSPPTPLTASGVTEYGFDPTAYFVNVTGKGGYLSAGLAQSIVTVSFNEDVLLIGFTYKQTRFVYTGNDLSPFLFYVINSEFGSSATFSGITLDRGALTIGAYGLSLTSQEASQRIDLVIPDVIFDIANTNHGSQRVNAARDFFREWIYFSYPYAASPWVFPTQTLFYNYRDNTWGIFYENYTAHGSFRVITGNLTWATIGLTYPTWSNWNDPWNSSVTDVNSPAVCAGNQQGFVMELDVGTAEGPSGYITSITTTDSVNYTINSKDHCLMDCLMEGDYVQLKTLNGITGLNDEIGRVTIPLSGGNPDPDNFIVTFLVPTPITGTYIGGGQFIRLSQPFIQTKQFAPYWQDGRQVRLGTQRYLLDGTTDGEITVNIYVSQNPDTPWNSGPILPNGGSTNDALIYSDTLLTTVEPNSLTSPNPPASGQYQIWHQINTSLQGDTFQIGFTLSDLQMRDFIKATSEIAVQGMILQIYPGPYLG